MACADFRIIETMNILFELYFKWVHANRGESICYIRRKMIKSLI